jgi:hypothetical protein
MILMKSYELFFEIYIRDTIICYKFFRRVMPFIGDLPKGYYCILYALWLWDLWYWWNRFQGFHTSSVLLIFFGTLFLDYNDAILVFIINLLLSSSKVPKKYILFYKKKIIFLYYLYYTFTPPIHTYSRYVFSLYYKRG